ncbi:MAG: hypothetical protein C5B50_09875 [Verrucomicrobia bacterium]|nr:MAG: hypothetical protein C5B50_09875 [Verrucomicrobiota bacterium]
MKILHAYITVLLLSSSTVAILAQKADTNAPPVHINAAEARQYVGTNAVVSGKVAEVHKSRSVVSINFEKPYPNSPFAAIIFAANTNSFPDPDKFKDQTLEITGIIKSYQGRAEIILTKTSQLAVIEKPAEKEKK